MRPGFDLTLRPNGFYVPKIYVTPHYMELNSNTSDLRHFLEMEFTKRCRRNSKYSMRAFAKSLDIDQSFLSKVLSGKRRLTNTMTTKLAMRLGLSPSRISEILNNSKNTNKYIDLNEDKFAAISDWYHFAIMELAKTSDFKSSHSWIAKKLNIGISEVNIAISRLIRLQLISAIDGAYKVTNDLDWTDFGLASAARQSLQRKIAEMSLQSIDKVSFEEREHAGLTVACSEKLIPKVKRKIQKFWKEIDSLVSEEPASEVYQLSIGFFPLTKRGK